MVSYIYLITIELDSPLYLTDMHRNLTNNGHDFISGKVKVDSAVVQKSQPSANDFNITLSAVDQTLVSAIANTNYKGKRCLIERAILNDDETISSTEIWLDGDLNKYTYTNKLNESTIKLSVSSIFAAFDAIKMVNIGAQFASTINEDQTLYWGKVTPDVPIDWAEIFAQLPDDWIPTV